MLQIKSHQLFHTTVLFRRLKVLTGAFVFALVFSLVLVGEIFHDGFPAMFVLTYIQVEIFLWLGYRFFNGRKKTSVGLKKQVIIKLLIFYALVLTIATLFFIAVFYIQYMNHSYGDDGFFSTLARLELKGFILATVTGFALGTLFFFYEQWSDALRREQRLMQEKLLFQYETLKAQVNPHFLFNSLNTLSSLVRHDPDMSELYIQKFSRIYRYILDNQDKNLVSLVGELEFVHDYFMLQKIRDEEKIELHTEILLVDDVEVAPVSLQLLVENALKHNSATRSQPLKIEISQEGKDTLVVRNRLQPKSSLINTTGTGLKNLNERCQLILQRSIEVVKTDTEFIVKLPGKIS